MVSKILTIATHLYHGTLIDAVNQKIEHRQQHKRIRKWQKCKTKGVMFRDRLPYGVKIKLNPRDKVCEYIFEGTFELTEQYFVRNFLRPGDCFVDIGANIGLFTLIAADVVKKNGRVYSFEPCTETYNMLLENVRINKFSNVECIPVALSDKEEMRILTISIDGYGAWNSLAAPTAGKIFRKENIQCTTLDNFSSDNHLTGEVTLMKLDVEGWELYVLNGGENTLTRHDAPDLLVEFTDENAQAAGNSCKALYNRLFEFGYSMYRIETTNHSLCYDPPREVYPYSNLLASKRVEYVCDRLGFQVL